MHYISILIVLMLTSCNMISDAPLYGEPRPGESPRITLLALGDSYTIGQSVSQDQRWPYHLGISFRDELGTNIQITYIAQTGWTTANLISAINPAALASSYDLVTLLIGVNNQYQGRSTSEYSSQFTDLLSTALSLAGHRTNHVLVVSIPDYAYTPFVSAANKAQVSAEIDAFNSINSNISVNAGVAYFNITPLSREGLIDTSLVAGDGLHPSGKQYQRWVEEVIFPGLLERMTNE